MVTQKRLSQLRSLTLLPALVATGCVMMPPTGTQPAREATTGEPGSAPASAPSRGEPQVPAPSATGPGALLLAQARSERAAGEYRDAIASLERALRIDPDNPWLWLELGETSLAAGDPGQAEEMARKALSLAAGNARLMNDAERLLARAQTR